MTTSLSTYARHALIIAGSATVLACNVTSGEGESSHYEFDSDPSGLGANEAGADAIRPALADGGRERVMPGADETSGAAIAKASAPVRVSRRARSSLAGVAQQVVTSDDGKTVSITEVGTRLDGSTSHSVKQEEQ